TSADGTTDLDDSWEWNGNDWTQVTTVVQPSQRSGHAMAQEALGKVLLFGGLAKNDGGDKNDTWEWNGTGWTLLNPTVRTPASRQSAMAYDSVRGKIIQFGGFNGTSYLPTGSSGIVYEWSGSNWASITPTSSPNPIGRATTVMAYDSARQVTVVFGGYI